MKTYNILGYCTVLLIIAYLTLKITTNPGPAQIMLVAGVLLAFYLPLSLLNQIRSITGTKPETIHKFGGLLLGLVIVSAVLRLHHWRIVKIDPNEIIPIISFLPQIELVLYYTIAFVFIPWLIYHYRSRNLLKNIIGGLGAILVILGLVGSNFKLIYHDELIIVGNAFIALIYIPWHIWWGKKSGTSNDSFFRIIIGIYILITFLFGVFQSWHVTRQDIIIEMNQNEAQKK